MVEAVSAPWSWDRREPNIMGVPLESFAFKVDPASGLSIGDVRAEVRRGWDLTTAQVEAAVAERRFDDALMRVGNEDRHSLLLDWWVGGFIGADEMAHVILTAWEHGASDHLDALGSETWREMFEATGFVADPPRPRPSEAMVVYRAQPTAAPELDRKSTRLNSSHLAVSRMPSSA